MIKLVKQYRLNGLINIYTSIYWNHSDNSIQIYTDEGRPIRPLIISDYKKFFDPKNKVLIWNDLISNIKNKGSFIEYIDPYETNNIMIATFQNDLRKKINYTHQ